MAGLFESLGRSGGGVNPAVEIMRGMAAGIQEKNAKQLVAELNAREQLAKQFEGIEKDEAYDPDARDKARNFAIAIRMLAPTDKRPKEFEPDPKLAKQLGLPENMAIPAYVQVTLRKSIKDGPKQPPEPKPPADPSSMFATAEAGMGGGGGELAGLPPMPAMPPQPGGQQLGPNQITSAPATPPGMPRMPTAPPELTAADYVSTRRSPEQIAAEAAERDRQKNLVSLEPDASGRYDARALPALGRQQTTAVQLRKLGLAPDGSPLPPEQLTATERAKIEHLKAQDELADAQIELARARAAGVPQMISIAQGNLQVKQQNANTAAQRVMIEGALYGDMMNSGGADAGAGQGLFGEPTTNNNPVDAWSEWVDTGQAEITDINDKRLRTMVVLNMTQKGMISAPKKMREALNNYTEARASVETIYEAIGKYMKSEGVDKVWSGYQLNGIVSANSRIVGKALGELRITDQDKEDFNKLLSPGTILTLTNPERAQTWVKSVEAILDRVEDKNLQGFYQRVYKRRGGGLSTFKPGDTKNVVTELGGGTGGQQPAIAPMPTAPASVAPTTDSAIPPIEQRVAGKTTAIIKGVKRVWNGTGWVKAP